MTPALFYLLIALALVAAELLIMQFSFFWFLFFGLGALVASLGAWLFPEMSWTLSTGLFVVASLGISAGLYSPLKKWQNQPSPIAGNDAIGQKAKVIEAITAERPGKVTWSGSDWPAQLSEGASALEVGDSATIVKLEGIRLIVSNS